ncbi:MAG: hypothetical protein Q9166_007013 [cf. Caloplaca sp. 2 TL-2023]
MIIDLETFQAIGVDSKGIAQVGAGVRLGNLATGIYNQGKRALPHGVCPGVGIGGHATHGGPPASAANSAYGARNALWVVQHYSTTPSTASGGAKRAIDFVNGLNDALGKGFGGYLNYVDSELNASQAHGLYYDKATYEKLVKVKGMVDPNGVYWNPQAVGV